MSHQIGTVFHAKEMSQILVLFILCESSGQITLVWNYYIGGTTQPLVLVGRCIPSDPDNISFPPVFL